jgi:putative membrane protein
MKNQQPPDWHLPQRQSASGLLIILYKAVITFVKAIWPVLVIILFRESSNKSGYLQVLVAVIGIIVLVSSLVNFYYFRFFIQQDDMVFRKGLINKKIITIPLKNIQAVHIEQTWMHQLFKIARVKIDTAGSDKAEATIDAIAIDKASMLRTYLMENEKMDSNDITKPVVTPLISLSIADVIKMGLTANHIQTFFIILAFTMSMYQNLEDIFGNIINRMLEESSSLITFTTSVLLSLAVFVLVISIVVSLLRMALLYFNFQLSGAEKGFRIRSGLTSIRQNLVPFSKIQYISWKANWVRRKLNIYVLEFHQANVEENKKTQKALVPVLNNVAFEKLVAPYHPEIFQGEHSEHQIHRAYAWRRLFIIGLPLGLAFTSLAWIFIPYYAFSFLLWLPIIYFSSMVFQKIYRLYINDDALQIYSGIWGREIQLLQWYKIQKIGLHQSPWQRKNNIANIVLYTAGGHIRIPYIDLDLANEIKNYALYKIESSQKNWL